MLLPRHEGFLALRNSNQLLRLVEGDSKEMALPKDIQRNPLKDEIKHVDLIIVRRGERVTVDVPLEVIGEVAPEHTYVLDVNSVPVEADALDLPDHVTIERRDLYGGEYVYVRGFSLPAGVQIDLFVEYLVSTVVLVIEQDLGEDSDEEASGEVPHVAEENPEKY